MDDFDLNCEPNILLEQIIGQSSNIDDINDIDAKTALFLNTIGDYCYVEKGVYTVLVTLMLYKLLHPEQDIRLHQANMIGGFSGRTFDTKYVTPTLSKLGLPAMAESGWLTRSLEQPSPYDMHYAGKIQHVKDQFLWCVNETQNNPQNVLHMMRILFNRVLEMADANRVQIHPLKNPEHLTIDNIVDALNEHFNWKYGTHNGSKLPVLAIYAIYQSLISEVERYKDCYLAPLASLTACDRTNRASGDVEIFKRGQVFESVEIKLSRKINAQILRVAQGKIYEYNPERYYILSVLGIDEDDRDKILAIVDEIHEEHGCLVVVNGLMSSIRYYLRLITNLNDFVVNYSNAVQNDPELRKIHKQVWADLIKKYKL